MDENIPAERRLLVTVEIPKGSRNKYEFDEHLGRIKLDRMLFSSVHYPSDYGFIAGTWAEDDDPLDAMVLVGEPTFPGCVIEAKAIGLFKMLDQGKVDYKILCVPVSDPQWSWVDELADVPGNLLQEIEHFFAIYKDLEMKTTQTQGWAGVPEALRVIRDSLSRYKAKAAAEGRSA